MSSTKGPARIVVPAILSALTVLGGSYIFYHDHTFAYLRYSYVNRIQVRPPAGPGYAFYDKNRIRIVVSRRALLKRFPNGSGVHDALKGDLSQDIDVSDFVRQASPAMNSQYHMPRTIEEILIQHILQSGRADIYLMSSSKAKQRRKVRKLTILTKFGHCVTGKLGRRLLKETNRRVLLSIPWCSSLLSR